MEVRRNSLRCLKIWAWKYWLLRKAQSQENDIVIEDTIRAEDDGRVSFLGKPLFKQKEVPKKFFIWFDKKMEEEWKGIFIFLSCEK